MILLRNSALTNRRHDIGFRPLQGAENCTTHPAEALAGLEGVFDAPVQQRWALGYFVPR